MLQESRETIERLASRILTVAIPDLLSEAERLHEELQSKRHVLNYLRRFAPQRMSQICQRFMDLNHFSEYANETNSHAAVAPWLSARNALTTNAEALLPTSAAK